MISPSPARRQAGFTLVELMITASIALIFSAATITVWSSLASTAVLTTTYAERQNDQMRVLDYIKRDVRRASSVTIYNGTALVTGTNFGSELRLTIPDYYADTREEDNAIGTRVANTPSVSGNNVTYGSPLTVRYYVLNGAVIRNDAGTSRVIGSASGAFTLSFQTQAGGEIRARIIYDQPVRSGKSRVFRRSVDTLCWPRTQLQS